MSIYIQVSMYHLYTCLICHLHPSIIYPSISFYLYSIYTSFINHMHCSIYHWEELPFTTDCLTMAGYFWLPNKAQAAAGIANASQRRRLGLSGLAHLWVFVSINSWRTQTSEASAAQCGIPGLVVPGILTKSKCYGSVISCERSGQWVGFFKVGTACQLNVSWAQPIQLGHWSQVETSILSCL